MPRPATLPIQQGTATGFDGLNHFDNRTAGSGDYAGTQFSLEPPDQALCASDTQIVESVNTVVRVRSTGGANLTSAVPLNEFFGLAPEINRTTGVYGDFTSDPKCYYDHDTSTWFLTLLQADVDPATGAFTGPTSVLVAASQTSDATGAWTTFKIDTTTDGQVGSNCPCLGDQPLIGADAYGFYVSTNVFPLFGNGFNGAMVYAISKADLAAGDATPTMQSFFEPTLAEGQAYSIQPATTPPGGAHASENQGTEYFLSSLDFNGTTDNRIALWTLSNTFSLETATPNLSLTSRVISSIGYGQPPAALQKDGSTPLKDYLGPSREHLNLLNSNDDRMNQTVYVNGQIWGAVNTIVKSPTGPSRIGIAYFMVNPLAGTVAKQGYIAVSGNNVMFPAIAANADGDGIVGFSLVGPDYYPSAAYVQLSSSSGPGPVKIAANGVGPADGFTGYRSIVGGNGVERWGDYSAAVADSAGNLWFATEYIGQSCTLAEALNTGFTCGNTRTLYANWGTYIAKVAPAP